jgi:hypothetical protein
MSTPAPSWPTSPDAEPQDGDHIALLMSPFNPPTMDHVRAVEALLKWNNIKHVWICPLASDADIKSVKEMCCEFCIELTLMGKRTSICTAALDKLWREPAPLVEWFKKHCPRLGLHPAYVAPNDPPIEAENAIAVMIGTPEAAPLGTTIVPLSVYLPVRDDIRESIGTGHDESRNLTRGVWAYIQKNRLYR